MHELKCTEIWGGYTDVDADVQSSSLSASLRSSSCDGGKGGDIYYLSVCGKDMLTRLAIADVVGHGQAVSDVSSFMYGALYRHMNSPDGHRVLEDLNQVASDYGLNAMTTAALLTIYKADHSLRYAYAGHPPFLIRRQADDAWSMIRPQTGQAQGDNTPLAVVRGARYDQHHDEVEPGDQILVYTDGVLEAMDSSDRLFGLDRLIAALNGLGHASLRDVKSAVIDAVQNHAGGNLSHDDVTVIAVQVR